MMLGMMHEDDAGDNGIMPEIIQEMQWMMVLMNDDK